MYEKFYGLTKEPFRLSPDSGFCYRHQSYKKASSYMQYALHRGEGFVMVTGRPGTGKTTLINDLISNAADGQTVFAHIVCTQVQADDLLRLVALKFNINSQTGYKSDLIHQLELYFKQLHYEGRRPLLIIDEAQDLSSNALEELRLLTNLQQNNKPLIQIFLIGQEALREIVHKPELEQLHQRIIAACHLQPLSEATTEEYVKHRLSQVAWQNDPQLCPNIFSLIYKFSLGIPRWINLICSRLLLHGMVEELHRLEVKDILSVLDGLIQEQLLPTELESELDYLRSALANQNNTDESPAVQFTEEAPNPPVIAEMPSTLIVYEPGPFPSAARLASDTDTLATKAATAPIEPEKTPLDIAKALYSQLAPQLCDKTKQRRLEIFLRFLNGQVINGSKISLPYTNMATVSSVGFMVWLESKNNAMTSDVRETIWTLFDLVDQ